MKRVKQMKEYEKLLALKSRNKKKAFTLIEMIVVLAITVMIACIIYTFYSSNSRTLTNAEAKSTLQLEGNQIQKDILNYGTQAKSIQITKGNIDDVKEFELTVYGNDEKNADLDTSVTSDYVFELDTLNQENMKGTTVYPMKIYKKGESSGNARSTHVKSVQIKPLDSTSSTSLNDASSVQITVNLSIKKGLSEVEYPVTTIVKLRNKNV